MFKIKQLWLITLILFTCNIFAQGSYTFYQFMRGDQVIKYGYTQDLDSVQNQQDRNKLKYDEIVFIDDLSKTQALELRREARELFNDTYTYVLTNKRGKVIYCGITNNPQRREREHRKEKTFYQMIVTSTRPMLRAQARRSEKVCMAYWAPCATCLPELNQIH